MTTPDSVQFNFDFRPSSYGDDPLEEILYEIPDDTVRSTDYQVLEKGWTGELQELLRQQGILQADGTFETEPHAIEWERPEEIEGSKIKIATLDTDFPYSNYVTAQRVGWEWWYIGNRDSVVQRLDSSSAPLMVGELINVLDGTGLIDHFSRSDEDEGYPHAGSRTSMIISGRITGARTSRQRKMRKAKTTNKRQVVVWR